MEAKFKIKITNAAEKDLDEIYNYILINFGSSGTAQNLMDKIELGIMNLSKFPYKHELSRDKVLKVKGYHKLLINNYVVLYLIDSENSNIIVARILYGAMDYNKYL
jgi:addiction module RelE/StbE family toxin